jgi:hypothetical protein
MNTFLKIAAAALSFVAIAAQAAPQVTASLPRVVVTGKAVATQIAQLPRVVITGQAVREMAQLPRVTVLGFSEAALQRRSFAAANATAKRA